MQLDAISAAMNYVGVGSAGGVLPEDVALGTIEVEEACSGKMLLLDARTDVTKVEDVEGWGPIAEEDELDIMKEDEVGKGRLLFVDAEAEILVGEDGNAESGRLLRKDKRVDVVKMNDDGSLVRVLIVLEFSKAEVGTELPVKLVGRETGDAGVRRGCYLGKPNPSRSTGQ
ncbi:hypothetical protein BDZ45DRAFT_696101 [Acephala macrosclerotiorum]|nr:hypothetical protein BDZ45DRAFT_696101 [Acephala macrosclerotiorum]